jgi:hypothetical protein
LKERVKSTLMLPFMLSAFVTRALAVETSGGKPKFQSEGVALRDTFIALGIDF